LQRVPPHATGGDGSVNQGRSQWGVGCGGSDRDKSGDSIPISWHVAGRQIAQVDQRGNPVYFAFDEVGNQVAEIDASGRQVTKSGDTIPIS